MKKLLLFLMVLVMFSLNVSAYYLEGEIKDFHTEELIKNNVGVYVLDQTDLNNIKVSFYKISNGVFSIYVNNDAYYSVTASASGYYNEEKKIRHGEYTTFYLISDEYYLLDPVVSIGKKLDLKIKTTVNNQIKEEPFILIKNNDNIRFDSSESKYGADKISFINKKWYIAEVGEFNPEKPAYDKFGDTNFLSKMGIEVIDDNAIESIEPDLYGYKGEKIYVILMADYGENKKGFEYVTVVLQEEIKEEEIPSGPEFPASGGGTSALGGTSLVRTGISGSLGPTPWAKNEDFKKEKEQECLKGCNAVPWCEGDRSELLDDDGNSLHNNINFRSYCADDTSVTSPYWDKCSNNEVIEYSCKENKCVEEKVKECPKEKPCSNGKCGGEIKESPFEIKLIVDSNFYESLNKKGIDKLNLDQDTTTFADFEDIICIFNVKKESFVERLDGYSFQEEVVYSISSNERQILSGKIKCNNRCSIKIPSELTKRGEKISCGIQYKDEIYLTTSNIAEFNYIFLRFDDTGFKNEKVSFDSYLELSALDEFSAKAIYLSGCPITLDAFDKKDIELEKKFCRDENLGLGEEDIDHCALEMLLYIKGKKPVENHLKICIGKIETSINTDFVIPNDVIIGLTGKLGTKAASVNEDNLIFLNTDNIYSFAHEIGHIYGLCEEYVYKFGWLRERDFLGNECSNLYPSCCVDSPDNLLTAKDEYGNVLCEENGGVCQKLGETECPAGYYSSLSSTAYDCRDKGFGNTCCIKSERLRKLGNNCYPLDTEAMPGCAGMPLNEDGTVGDISLSRYRSIMGSSAYKGPYKYPPEAPYPLNPKNYKGIKTGELLEKEQQCTDSNTFLGKIVATPVIGRLAKTAGVAEICSVTVEDYLEDETIMQAMALVLANDKNLKEEDVRMRMRNVLEFYISIDKSKEDVLYILDIERYWSFNNIEDFILSIIKLKDDKLDYSTRSEYIDHIGSVIKGYNKNIDSKHFFNDAIDPLLMLLKDPGRLSNDASYALRSMNLKLEDNTNLIKKTISLLYDSDIDTRHSALILLRQFVGTLDRGSVKPGHPVYDAIDLLIGLLKTNYADNAAELRYFRYIIQILGNIGYALEPDSIKPGHPMYNTIDPLIDLLNNQDLNLYSVYALDNIIRNLEPDSIKPGHPVYDAIDPLINLFIEGYLRNNDIFLSIFQKLEDKDYLINKIIPLLKGDNSRDYAINLIKPMLSGLQSNDINTLITKEHINIIINTISNMQYSEFKLSLTETLLNLVFEMPDIDKYFDVNNVNNLIDIKAKDGESDISILYDYILYKIYKETSNSELANKISLLSLNVDKNAFNVAETADALNSNKIESLKNNIQNKYGVKPMRYFGYINDAEEIDLIKAFFRAEQVTNKQKDMSINIELIYTIAMLEGANWWVDGIYYGEHNSEINGFSSLGLDHFADEVVNLKSLGFISNDFNEGDEYFRIDYTNEKGQRVHSAYFKNIESGLEALGATIAYRKWLFLRDANELGINVARLTEDEIVFWIYTYFNPGQNYGKQKLKEDGINYFKPWKGNENLKNAQYLALQRVATYRWIKDSGVFNPKNN